MKHISWLGLVLLLSAFLVSFSPSPVLSASPEFVPGELLVRYKPNIAQHLLARTRAAELVTGDTTLDALNQMLGVQNIAPVFRAEHNTPLPQALSGIFKLNFASDQ